MKILLTGASGFLGSHLARLLVSQGCQVTALARPQSDLGRLRDVQEQIQLAAGDLLERAQVRAAVQQAQPDVCLHLGWYAEPGVYLHSPANLAYIDATLHLAQQLAEAGCRRLVVAGTVAEYDSDYGYLSESTPTRPGTLYAASKTATQIALAALAGPIGLAVAWARVFYIYGPAEHPKRFVPDVIGALLRGEPIRTTLGEQVRDYLHVADVAAALWAVAQSELTGVVNIGSGQPATNRQMVLKLGELTGRPELVRFGDLPYRPGDPMFVCADVRRLRRETGWQPAYDLESGLRQTVDWWREQQDA